MNQKFQNKLIELGVKATKPHEKWKQPLAENLAISAAFTHPSFPRGLLALPTLDSMSE
jgi:hypothetical protein